MADHDVADKLKQLEELREAGALSDEDYASAEAYLLQSENASGTENSIVPVIDEKLDPKYAKDFSESGFWDKVTGVLKKAGAEVIYKALQLYYATRNPNCPAAIKGTIYAALGYFILPIDLLPDVIPIVGFSDDLLALGAAIGMAHMYIDDDVVRQSRDKMADLFGEGILKELE